MQDCLDQLDIQGERVLDDILVPRVKMQLIAEKCARSSPCNLNIQLDDTLSPPPELFVHGMFNQLFALKDSMTREVLKESKSASSQVRDISELTTNVATVQLQLHAVELSLAEVALNGDPTVDSRSSTRRFQYLYISTRAVNQWFETLFAIPVDEMNGIPTSTLMQMRHALGFLFALSTIDEPEWSKQDLVDTVGLYPILDRLASLLSQIPAAVSARGISDAGECEDHWWTHVASTVRTLRSIWSGRDEHGNRAAPELTSFVPGDARYPAEAMDFDLPGLDWLIDPAMLSSLC